MNLITRDGLQKGYLDLETIKDVINGPADLNGNGSVVSRLGTALKTFARLIQDIEDDTDAFVSDSTFRIDQAVVNAFAQAITGGAPILSSESAALLPGIPSNSVADKQIVNLKGWHTANDGGDQVLIYSASSTATVNGGTVFPGPGGVLSFDPTTGAFIGTPGTGRYLSLKNRRVTPEQFGAKGDGITNDSTALQRCVNFAVSQPNCAVELNPRVSYGLGATLVLPASFNNIEFYGTLGEISISTSQSTFNKLANVLALDVQGQHYLRNFKIRGRGNSNPTLTDPAIESTPAILIRARARLDMVSTHNCGGKFYGTEPETDGYAIGIIQDGAANCNHCDLQRLNITSCKGGVYIARINASGGLNLNAIKVTLDNFNNCTGIGINANTGFRNHFEVKHAASASGAEAVFRLNYIENYAYCQYAESNVPVGVIFGSGAARNHVVFLNAGTFANYQVGTGGSVRDIQGNAWYGNQQRGDLHGEYGAAFDVLAGTTPAKVTWVKRDAQVASFGHLINISFNFQGSRIELASGTARLYWNNTIFPFTPYQLIPVPFPARLINSAGTFLVFLVFETTQRMYILDQNMQQMTFNNVTGSGEFYLNASISSQRRF